MIIAFLVGTIIGYNFYQWYLYYRAAALRTDFMQEIVAKIEYDNIINKWPTCNSCGNNVRHINIKFVRKTSYK